MKVQTPQNSFGDLEQPQGNLAERGPGRMGFHWFEGWDQEREAFHKHNGQVDFDDGDLSPKRSQRDNTFMGDLLGIYMERRKSKIENRKSNNQEPTTNNQQPTTNNEQRAARAARLRTKGPTAATPQPRALNP